MPTVTTKSPAAQALRVLVVDDDLATAESYAILMRLWGHDPSIALDGNSALELVENQVFDAILLDLGMPQMSGFEVAERIRQRWPYKPPLLIAQTGYGTTDMRERSNQVGIDLYLLKPIDPVELQSILAHCPRTLETVVQAAKSAYHS